MTLEQRLDKAEQIIKQPSFRQNKGLGNEVGYYIFDYKPEDELTVRQRIQLLQIKNENDDFELQVFDLYDIINDILNEKGYLERCFSIENNKGLDQASKAVTNTLKLSRDSLVVKYICDRVKENSVVFLVGAGKCYPILRAHTILTQLHQVLDNVPVVLFLPGEYTGLEIKLFSVLPADYYRAFKLVD